MTRVQHLREARGLTQREIARAVGISSATLSRIEAGCRQPSAAIAQKLAGIFGFEVEELFPSGEPQEDIDAEQ